MSHARAAIAGVLAVGIVLLLVNEGPLRESERAFAAFVGLLSVLLLLMDIPLPVIGRRRRDDGDRKEDDDG